MTILAILAVAFFAFTNYPPELGIFSDPTAAVSYTHLKSSIIVYRPYSFIHEPLLFINSDL